jgi:hypothetical protein
LLLAYPATAVDVFGYIAHGRLLAEHNVNPFIKPPNAYPTDDIVRFLAYPDEPSQYGAAWVLVGDVIAGAAHGNLLVEMLLYKLVATGAHLASAVLVYAIAIRLGTPLARARASALLFAWNPMLLWEMVGNAHNDGLMMLCGLLALWLFVVRADVLVLPALAAGVLIKLPAVLVAPVLFVGIWHRSWVRALEGVGLALVLCVAVYRPFWVGLETLTALRRTELFTASLGSVLRLSLMPALGQPEASAVARLVSLAAFGLVAGVALVLALRGGDARRTVLLAYVTLLGGLLLATTWFQAWYVVWPFAFGAALGDPRRHLEVALLSLGGLLQYFVFIYLWVMGLFPPTENLAVQSAAYLCIVGPLLLGLAARGTPRRLRLT